ncbi:hypothetical protein HQ560_10530, partial [bacterium]|nr:hypothetical protein [bacterium]
MTRSHLITCGLLCIALFIALGPVAAAEDAPAFQRSFVQKGNFLDTVLESRARFQAGNRVYASSPWVVSGWEGKSLGDALPPDKGPIEVSKKSKFRRTRESSFHEAKRRVFFGGDITYLYREYACTEACSLKGLIDLNRGQARVVFNGKTLLQADEKAVRRPSALPLALEFAPGKNTLLIKLVGLGRNTFRLRMNVEPMDVVLGDLQNAYPVEMELLTTYFRDLERWVATPASDALLKTHTAGLVRKLDGFAALKAQHEKTAKLDPGRDPRAYIVAMLQAARVADQFSDLRANWAYLFNPEALRRAITDLKNTHANYPGDEFLTRLDAFKDLASLGKAIPKGREADLERCQEYLRLRRKALLANPLIDFDEVVLVKREQKGKSGFPQNYEGNSSVDWYLDDSIVTLRIKDPDPELHVLYKPKQQVFCGDIDLDYGGEKLLFSSIGKDGNWHVFEIDMDGTGLRQVSQSAQDLDNYDAVYLPDSRIIYNCTSGYAGVPCVGGNAYVANLHIMDRDGRNARRLTFEQDNDWHPTVMANGRVMFLRWEYTDSSHYFSRVLMHMNPDGTNQSELYGSNSYWPNGIFYARPVPGGGSRFVGIVSGHHGVARYGQCVLFDPAKGRHEADGAVQAIPGYGKTVEA